MMAAQHETQQSQQPRQNNSRLGWILAAIAILLYVGGLFIQRG